MLTVTCIVTPAVVRRTGTRAALIACHFLIAAGMLLLLLPTTHVSWGVGWYVTFTVVAGIGYGISFSVVADTAVAAVPPERAGSAAAIAETSNEIGNAQASRSSARLPPGLPAPRSRPRRHLNETLRIPGLPAAMTGTARTAFVTGLHAAAAIAGALHAALGIFTLCRLPRTLTSTGTAQPRPPAQDVAEESGVR